MSNEHHRRYAIRRRKLLAQYTCICCKDLNPDVVQWHHVDPSTKLTDVYRHHIGEEKWWDEVLKCVPLCANCHVKLHKEKLCLLPIHL